MKTITLTADEKLIEAAHARARAEQTTLDEEFQRWLADYAGQSRSANALTVIAELRRKVKTGGRKFSRDEMNER